MSEYRFDPYYGIWVAIATIRGVRPHEFEQQESRVADARCPFCQGHERETPPAVLELTAADAPAILDAGGARDWIVRVVPNKYPAITPVEREQRTRCLPYGQKAVGGFQEILVESPRHVASFSELTELEMYLTLHAIQQRILAGRTNPEIEQISVFKNCRPEAGASLEHAHSQLVFSRFTADAIQQRWRNCDAYWQQHQVDLIQAMRDWELDAGARIVETADGYASFCPFASRFPFQIWIVPEDPTEAFESIAAPALIGLGKQIRACIARLEWMQPRAPYNLLLHLPPLRSLPTGPGAAYRWFVEIIPRLGRFAGYELLGAGWINEAPPEMAAERLRSATHHPTEEHGGIHPGPRDP